MGSDNGLLTWWLPEDGDGCGRLVFARKGRGSVLSPKYLRNHLSHSHLFPVTVVQATIVQNLDHSKSPGASRRTVSSCWESEYVEDRIDYAENPSVPNVCLRIKSSSFLTICPFTPLYPSLTFVFQFHHLWALTHAALCWYAFLNLRVTSPRKPSPTLPKTGHSRLLTMLSPAAGTELGTE